MKRENTSGESVIVCRINPTWSFEKKEKALYNTLIAHKVPRDVWKSIVFRFGDSVCYYNRRMVANMAGYKKYYYKIVADGVNDKWTICNYK